jgi:hypothetical protein
MTARNFVAVLLRVLGLYLLVTTAIALPGQIAFMMVPGTDEFGGSLITASNVGAIVGFVGRIVVGAVLFFKSRAVSTILVPVDTKSLALVGGDQFYVAALALFGIWLLVGGLEDLAASGTLLCMFTGDERNYLIDRELQTIARGGVSVIAGAVLIVGRDRLQDLWMGLRGLRADDED